MLDSNNDEAEEEEDEDLKPYDLRDDVRCPLVYLFVLHSNTVLQVQPTGVERPTYIRELISVLTSVNSSAASNENNAPARLEAAMGAAPEIIRGAAHELRTLPLLCCRIDESIDSNAG